MKHHVKIDSLIKSIKCRCRLSWIHQRYAKTLKKNKVCLEPLNSSGMGKSDTKNKNGTDLAQIAQRTHLFVCWNWEFVNELLSSPSPPLNVKGNGEHPFARVLTEARI